jgi:tetratricopeptide (TPR) repeat protein
MNRHSYVFACLIAVALSANAATPVSVAARQQSSPQDWYQLYTSAKDDIKKQAWAEAERKLQQAKKSGPAQGPRTLVRGGLIVPFSADYYLGEAYLGQGRLKEAIAAFDAAGKQNLNAKTGEFARLGEQRASAVTRLTDEVIRTAQADVTKGDFGAARTKAQEAGTLGGNAAGVASLLASIQTAEDRAKAAAAVPAPTPTPPTSTQTPPPPTQTESPVIPKGTPPTGTAATGTLGSGAKTEYQPPGAATGTKPSAINPTNPGVNAALERQRAQANALVEVTAMRQFFSGDYTAAINTLSSLTSPRALYYKACSRAGLALLSGDRDATTLTLARQEYRSAVASNSNFSRDEPYISPRVLQLLQTQE